MNIADLDAKFKEDTDDIAAWSASTYSENFSQYFDRVKSLYARIKDDRNPITDKELEDILTTLPLELFSVSEQLNTFKAKLEVIKIKIKQNKREAQANSTASTQTARREEAAYSVLEDELLVKAYTTLIERVDSEISFARELIMSAKKIWSARKQTETLGVSAESITQSNNPPTLPDYSYMDGKEYIQ